MHDYDFLNFSTRSSTHSQRADNLKPRKRKTRRDETIVPSLRNLIQLRWIKRTEFTFAFFRAFARSTKSKQTLTLNGMEILKCIVPSNTILSFSGRPSSTILLLQRAHLPAHFIPDYQLAEWIFAKSKGVTNLNFASCSNEHCLYAAISRTFSISNLNCNKIDIRILFATNFFIPRVTERARLDESERDNRWIISARKAF